MTARLDRIVNLPDKFGRLDVHRILVAKRASLHPHDETEALHMLR